MFNTSGIVSGGNFLVKFSRNFTTGDKNVCFIQYSSNFQDLQFKDQNIFLLFAVGPSADITQKHALQGTVKVNLFQGKVITPPYRTYHASFMFVSWGVLSLHAFYFGRYMKVLGKLGIHIHEFLNLIVVAFSLAALALIMMVTEWTFYVGAHEVLKEEIANERLLELLCWFL